MDIVTAVVRGFEDWDVSALQNAITRAKSKNQSVLPVMVDSYGGSVYGLFKMIDSLNSSGLKIVTILNGVAMSAGAFLFSIGEERYMSANSTMMIHEAGFMAIGKHKEIQSVTNHVTEMNDKLFALLDKNSNQPDGYFKDLYYVKNQGADTYLKAEQALEHGLVTEIRIPEAKEIINKQKSINSISEYQNFMSLMAYSEPENHISIEPKEVKTLDLNAVLGTLSDEQKKPITELTASLTQKQTELDTVTSKLTEKDNEINSLKTSYENKINSMIANQDKEFVESLLANHQLRRFEVEKEIKVLSSLSSVPEAKEAYKEKLAKLSKVVEGEIPDNGEREHNFDSSANVIDGIKAYAEKNKIDMTTSDGYQKATAGYKKGVK